MLGTGDCITDTTGTPTLGQDQSYNGSADQTLVHYYYLDNSGTKQTITITYGSFTIQTNFGFPATTEYAAQQHTLPVSISYPDGTYYLTYEQTPGYPGSTTGRVASLTLPTGGIIQYTYSGPNGNYSDWLLVTGSGAGAPSSSINRITSNGTTSFTQSYPNSTVSNTTIQYPSGRTAIYSFAGGGQQVLTGIAESGQTTSVCYSGPHDYNGNPYSCATQDIFVPITSRQTTTTLDNGLSRVTTETFNNMNLLTERDESDFAASNPSVSRKTLITYYNSFVNKFDRVQQVTAEDAGGNIISQANYSYDQTSAMQTSGLPNHTVPAIPPGNLTQVSLYNSGGSALVTNYTVDDAGQLQSASGPGPGQTTFYYDPTDTHVIKTISPQAGSVSLSSEAAYNQYTGQLASQTDSNGHIKLYQYDGSLRLRTTTNDTSTGGDGAVITHTYNPSNVQIGTTQTIGNGSSTDVEAFTDLYGREKRVATSTGTNTWLLSDACYDGDGRTSFQSLPYSATSLSASNVCSGAGDSYSYDTNGRIQSVTHSDSSQTTYSYTGRAVKMVDEGAGGVQSTRVVQSDGLGRIAQVCEYSAGTGLAGSPAASGCGTDINVSGPDATATGYITQYSYNLSNRTMTASQSGSTRTWQYDSLGRLISDQVPERSGTTTFGYTFNSTGPQVSRTKLAPNQPWGTASPTTVTATSQMDAIGRPVSVSYNDGVTATTTYAYDAGLSNPQSHNMLGKLASATSGAHVAQFSYTSNGQIEWMRSCLASTCANAAPTFIQQSLSYNLLQAPVSISDGAGNSVGYQYDTYGRLGGVTEAMQSAGFPAILLSGFNYGPFGLTSVAFGNGLTGSYGFDGRGRPSSFHAVTGSQSNVYGYDLVWGANGSLLHSSDTQNDDWGYTYDEFNRLKTAVTDSNSHGYSYQYDVWGNRWNQSVIAGTGYTMSNSFDPGHTNHIVGWTYDVVGNVLWDGSHNYTYDPEGRVLTVDATTQYVYGPDGSRWQVNKTSGSRDYVYTPSGQLSNVWSGGSLVKANVYVGGGKLGSYTASGISFEYADWTGSTRVITNSSGTPTASFSTLPFGMLSPSSTGSDQAQSSGLDWDSESQTGHAWARQYQPQSGVWMSPDPSNDSYDLTDPQSLNRYAYVGNNPMTFSDPLGLARYADAPDPNGPFGASNSAFYAGNDNNNQTTGCQPGTGDVCGMVRAAWDWLSSYLGGGGGAPPPPPPPPSDDGVGGLGAYEFALYFHTANSGPTLQGRAQQQMSSPGASPATGSQPMIQGVAAGGTYSSKKAAALAAEGAGIGDTRGAAKGGKYEEFGGWIISKDGRYTYTNPVTFGDPQHFFADNVTVPGGYTAVGGYHTHPGLVASVEDAFSPQDAAWANGHGMPAYLGVAVNGNVRVYNPGQPYDRWLGTPGTLIGNVR